MLFVVVIPLVSAVMGLLLAWRLGDSPIVGALLGGIWGPIGLITLLVVRTDRKRYWLHRGRPRPSSIPPRGSEVA